PIQKPHPPLWTGGSAEAALKRAGAWANGFISGSAAIADFHVTWDKIASYAAAAGRNPNEISKASLAFMAINDDKAKAVKAVEDYTMRYYGRLRTAVEPVSIVGSPDQCVEKIQYFTSTTRTVPVTVKAAPVIIRKVSDSTSRRNIAVSSNVVTGFELTRGSTLTTLPWLKAKKTDSIAAVLTTPAGNNQE